MTSGWRRNECKQLCSDGRGETGRIIKPALHLRGILTWTEVSVKGPLIVRLFSPRGRTKVCTEGHLQETRGTCSEHLGKLKAEKNPKAAEQ